MNCKKCGNVITNLDQTCPNCGEPNELYTGSVDTAIPEAPVAPVEPAAPVIPEAPVAPVEPAAPVIPEAPVAPVEPAAPVMPEAPVAPVEPAAPVMPEEPAVNPLNQPTAENVTMASTTPATTEKPKKNVLFVITIILLALVIIGLGVFIGYKLLNPSNSTPQNVDEVETKPQEVSQVNTTEILDFGGLTFTIPEGLTKKTLDGYTVLVDSTNGYMIALEGMTDEAGIADIKVNYPTYETIYKENITSQGGNYIGAQEYTLNGRTYFGISYYANSVYSDIIFTEVSDSNYLFNGEIIYQATSKDVAYKATNEFLSSAKSQKAGSFAKTITKDKILNGDVTVRDEIE